MILKKTYRNKCHIASFNYKIENILTKANVHYYNDASFKFILNSVDIFTPSSFNKARSMIGETVFNNQYSLYKELLKL